MENTNTMPDNELEQRYKRYKEVLKNLTIMSDIFMRNVFKKRECVEYVLRIIMEKTNLQVLEQIIQMDYKNLQGRSAILDCVARDNEDKRDIMWKSSRNEKAHHIKGQDTIVVFLI